MELPNRQFAYVPDVRPLGKSEIEQRKYREWKPEWTDSWGYVPPISELPEWDKLPDGRCPGAHYLGYVDGAGI